MKYAHIDSSNFILGWYTTDLHSTIPTPNVEVEDTTWTTAINNGHNHVTNDGVTSYVDPRTLEDRENEVRATRNALLKYEVDPIVSNPLRWADMTTDKQTEWADYRTSLLSLTDQSGFPDNVMWPTKPELATTSNPTSL